MSGNRMSVYEAAEYLGLTVDAIRKRIQRSTIPHEKDEQGRVWVILDVSSKVHDTDEDIYQTDVRDELINELRDQVRFLREELARKDAILLRMAESIPQLEAPSHIPSGGPEKATEGASDTRAPPVTRGAQEPLQPKRRGFWSRLFGG